MHRVYLSSFFGAFNAIALPIRKKCDLEEFEEWNFCCQISLFYFGDQSSSQWVHFGIHGSCIKWASLARERCWRWIKLQRRGWPLANRCFLYGDWGINWSLKDKNPAASKVRIFSKAVSKLKASFWKDKWSLNPSMWKIVSKTWASERYNQGESFIFLSIPLCYLILHSYLHSQILNVRQKWFHNFKFPIMKFSDKPWFQCPCIPSL